MAVGKKPSDQMYHKSEGAALQWIASAPVHVTNPAEKGKIMLALSNSVHLYARPDTKERFLGILYQHSRFESGGKFGRSWIAGTNVRLHLSQWGESLRGVYGG